MEILSLLSTGPARARVARILRDDLPLVVRFTQAAVFLPGPSGPRLLATTESDGGPSRLRAALVATASSPAPRTVSFSADGKRPAGEALVVSLSIGGALVVYREGGRWSADEVRHAVATARFVARALAWSAVFA